MKAGPALAVVTLLAVEGAGWAEPAATVVTDAAAMDAICRTVEPPDAVSFPGNAFERGQQRAAYRESRDAALARPYVAEIPNTGFQLLEYDLDAQEIEIDTDEGLTAHDGGTVLVLQEHESLVVQAAAERAREIAELHQRGQLVLRVGFTLRAASVSPCSRSRVAGAPVRVEIDVASFELREGSSRTVARVELQPSSAAGVSPNADHPARPPGPDLTFREPTVLIDGNLGDLLETPAGAQLRERYLACWSGRLAASPELEGTIVVQMTVAGGHLRAAHLEIDSIGDEDLAACVLERTRSFPFPRGVSGAISLPVRFRP
jgi:hypothetical protein